MLVEDQCSWFLLPSMNLHKYGDEICIVPLILPQLQFAQPRPILPQLQVVSDRHAPRCAHAVSARDTTIRGHGRMPPRRAFRMDSTCRLSEQGESRPCRENQTPPRSPAGSLACLRFAPPYLYGFTAQQLHFTQLSSTASLRDKFVV